MSNRTALVLAVAALILWARSARASTAVADVSFDGFDIGRPGGPVRTCTFDNQTNTVIGCTP